MHPTLPYRGDGRDRPAGLALPPRAMPPWHRGRALKRWRYVGVYAEPFMLCAGTVRIGGVPQAFWALWDRERRQLHERTTMVRTRHVHLADGRLAVDDRGVLIDLRVEPGGDVVEVVSDHRGAHIWTRKQPVTATGTVTIEGDSRLLQAAGLIDDSAGYYARRTDWEWSAGVGAADDGRPVAWNLVAGVHDAPQGSERTLWVDGVASEVGPVQFATGLDGVRFAEGGELRFTAEAVRRDHVELLVVASDYVQPFGLATGTLPGGIVLARGYGVMERHSARW
jgi:uncharacterized protein DUF2804